MFLHADSEDSDAQADLSLHWAQRSFCWFCLEAAQLYTCLTLKFVYQKLKIK